MEEMNTPRLKPFLYKDECEKHGKNVNFIVEPQGIDMKTKTIAFIFYCKKCWHIEGVETCAWRSVLTFKEYNDHFGFNQNPKDLSDN